MALEITEGNIKQTVYVQNCSGKANRTVIQVDNFWCQKTFLFRRLHFWSQVKSKVNSIMIDGCSKTSLVVHRCFCCAASVFYDSSSLLQCLTRYLKCAGVY